MASKIESILFATILAATAGCATDPAHAFYDSDEEGTSSTEQDLALWRNDQNGIIVPGIGFWGDWREHIYCNAGMWATGYRMRVEASQGGGDDTALNSVQLFCTTPTGRAEWITSFDGLWGGWTSASMCSGPGNYANGARIRIEGGQGRGDDTATNDVEFACTQGGTISAPGGAGWGSWGNWTTCPNNTAICGLQIRFEGSQGGGDDTAMNGLKLDCCTLP